jgi:hypothetical protein
MSSLAATQADGYYLPPEYFESGAYRRQSKNQFAARQECQLSSSRGSKRQRGHNQWLQDGVVRFELPYKGICGGCGQSIGRGTRFNAHKTVAGNYHTTPIYQFEMQCHCSQKWIIQTHPQQRGFDYVGGIKLQAGQETNLALEHHQYPVDGNAVGGGDGGDDALVRLEATAQGKQRALTEIEELQRLQKLNRASTLNDADNNALIRQSFRHDRKEQRKRLQEGVQKGWRNGTEVLPLTVRDIISANDVVYGLPKDEERRRLSTVRKSSIFSSRTPTVPKRDDGSLQIRNRRKSHKGGEATIAITVGSSNVPSNNSIPGTPNMADRVTSSRSTELAVAPVPYVEKLKRRLGSLGGSHHNTIVVKAELSTPFCSSDGEAPRETFKDTATHERPRGLASSSFLEMMAAYESDEE